MNMHKVFIAAGTLSLAFLLNGCSIWNAEGDRTEVTATYVSGTVTLDGKLDEPAWHNTPAYSLTHAKKQFRNFVRPAQEYFSKGVIEPGKVRLLWNEKYLFIGFEFTDADVIAEGETDQLNHYLLGDVAEVFLKPENQTWYWECYVTPKGKKTAFFFPSRGMVGLPSVFSKKIALKDLKAAGCIRGSVNNPWDKDRKWTAEMAIPREEIGLAGEKLAPDVPWLIFFGRYNYGRNLKWRDLSAYPEQERMDYHIHEDYARLKMVK